MQHGISLTGYRFSLRPVAVNDAEFIVKLRTDARPGHFLHEISSDADVQRGWIEKYLERPGDWYFTIRDIASGQREGLIGLYDYDEPSKSAEWGRWIVRPGSVAALESALLIYRTAFEVLEMDFVYSRTIKDNGAVVSFHDSCGAPRSRILEKHFELGGTVYDAVEHRVDHATWKSMQPKLEALASRLASVRERSA